MMTRPTNPQPLPPVIGGLMAAVALTLGVVLSTDVAAQPPTQAQRPTGKTSPRFAREIAPFLKRYCVECHGEKEPEAGLSLAKYRDSARVQTDFAVWEKVARLLVERQMPPEDASQPKPAERQAAIVAIRAELATYDCQADKRPGRVTIRRLNREEYNNTIRDLIGIDFKPAADFPSDDVGHGFDNIGDVLSLPPILLEKYLDAADDIVARAFKDPAARKRIVRYPFAEMDNPAQAVRKNLVQFANRAFRRPVRPDELERLFNLARTARQRGTDREAAFQVVIKAILVSPHFLFRVETAERPDEKPGIYPLNDFQLASRLSFFLWSSMPDEELYRLARADKLRDPAVIRKQVQRMLRDPKSAALTRNFAGQWLQFRNLDQINPDPKRFPDFDGKLRAAMRRETELFFQSIVREDRSVLEFLDADYSFVNGRLARHYGIPDIEGETFQRVKLPARRRGVLTQGSVLLLTSNPTRTSPVKRGKWILDNILGEPPPPPPDGIEPLDEDAETLGSLRARMEQHRANPSCAVCHQKMDVLGFGLENFDVTGGWRDRDGRFAINPAGQLPGGKKFGDAAELMGILAETKRDEFCRCLTEKMLTYALGRGLKSFDRCAVETITRQLAEHDYRFGELVVAIATSEPFRLRESRVP